MAQITITIPNPVLQRVLDAVASQLGWVNEELHGTKQAFAKQQAIKWIKDMVKAHESALAAQQAQQNAEHDVDKNIDIT